MIKPHSLFIPVPASGTAGSARRLMPAAAPFLLLSLSGCEGPQSALWPAGREAEVLVSLFWIMVAGATLLWLLLNGLFFFLLRVNASPMRRRTAEMLIVGGGIVLPTVVLATLLSYALMTMPQLRPPGEGLVVRVTGKQWWWEVEYLGQDGRPAVVSANEIRLPVGRRTEFLLTADRVIHSFWIPSLGGKTDMFPGRETRMSLEPTRPGTYRGQCAEFCGASHAMMAFSVVAMPEEQFEAWLAGATGTAAAPDGNAAERGLAVFMAQGCGACHTVRGTAAAGRIGPDLTRVGERQTIGAGIMATSAEHFARWVGRPGQFKPAVHMPAYNDLSQSELADLGEFLAGLK